MNCCCCSGKGTFIGKDHTIHADVDGIVTFTRSKLEGFRRKKWRRYANVVPYTVREGAQGNEIKGASYCIV
jgi:ribosomal protein L27